jgi:hypothetical protein
MSRFRSGVSESSRRIAALHSDVLESKGGFFGRLLQAKPDRGGKLGLEFTADDLKKLVVAGKPLMLDHDDEERGEIGRVLHQYYNDEDGWLYIWGQVHGEGSIDAGLRQRIMSGLRTASLGSLSAGYVAPTDLSTGAHLPEYRRCTEVSLVDAPRYEGTHLLTVNAGADSLSKVQLYPEGAIESMSDNQQPQYISVAERAMGRALSDEEKQAIAGSPNPQAVVNDIMFSHFAQQGELPSKGGEKAAAAPAPAEQEQPSINAAQLAAQQRAEAQARETEFLRNKYREDQAPHVAKLLETLGKTLSKEEYQRVEKMATNLASNPAPEAADLFKTLRTLNEHGHTKAEEIKKLKSENAALKAENGTYKTAAVQYPLSNRGRDSASKPVDRDASPARSKVKAPAAGQELGPEVSVAASRRAMYEEMAQESYPSSSFNRNDPRYAENEAMIAILRNAGPGYYMQQLSTNFSQRPPPPQNVI